MNYVVIILAVIFLILIYILYSYFSSTSSTLVPSASLKTVSPPITPINNPTYVSYAYGVWVYINTWDPNANKVIFNREKNIRVYLDKNSPTLYCALTMKSALPDGTMEKTIMVTDNFPIQKWTYVIVSVDNQFMDVYVDGKLIKSQRFFVPPTSSTSPGIMPATPPDNPEPVYLGNSDTKLVTFTAFDAYLALFTRWTTAMDPQTAWNTYMAGNGGSSLSKTFSSYNVNLDILQNNVLTSRYPLY